MMRNLPSQRGADFNKTAQAELRPETNCNISYRWYEINASKLELNAFLYTKRMSTILYNCMGADEDFFMSHEGIYLWKQSPGT